MPPPWSCASSRCRRSIRFSIGGCVENSVVTALLTLGRHDEERVHPLGLAQVLVAGTRCIALEIFTSADGSALGRPVIDRGAAVGARTRGSATARASGRRR